MRNQASPSSVYILESENGNSISDNTQTLPSSVHILESESDNTQTLPSSIMLYIALVLITKHPAKVSAAPPTAAHAIVKLASPLLTATFQHSQQRFNPNMM